jgi:hypothetical protein
MNKETYKLICDLIENERCDWIDQTQQMNDALDNLKNSIKDYFEVEE